jgi:hypothetical protein
MDPARMLAKSRDARLIIRNLSFKATQVSEPEALACLPFVRILLPTVLLPPFFLLNVPFFFRSLPTPYRRIWRRPFTGSGRW